MPQEQGELDFEAIVGRRVRRMREEMGLTQRALAHDLRFCGLLMQPATLAKLEAGARPVRLNEVVQLAAYFHRPVGEMYAPLADLERHAPQRLAEAAARTEEEIGQVIICLIEARQRGEGWREIEDAGTNSSTKPRKRAEEWQEIEGAFADSMAKLRKRLVVQRELLRLAEGGQAAQVTGATTAKRD